MVDGVDKFFPDREAEIDSNPLQETVTRCPAPGAAPRFIGDKVLTFERAHEGERKYVTILVADIVDYSSPSEKLTSEEQYRIMARCHEILCDEVGLYRGTMTLTSGGTAKAVFGAPLRP